VVSVPQPRSKLEQWVEQPAIWTVPVVEGGHNHRVVFDLTVPAFVNLRQRFATVTMVAAKVEFFIDNNSTTTGSIWAAFATDRTVARGRDDIIGRAGATRATHDTAELRAQLGGVHASRHVDPNSRGGNPGLVLDWDSNVSIACTARIEVAARCVGPLDASAGTIVGPQVPVYGETTQHIKTATNVVGLYSIVVPVGHRLYQANNVAEMQNAGGTRVATITGPAAALASPQFLWMRGAAVPAGTYVFA
jgi:hypothetical protein